MHTPAEYFFQHNNSRSFLNNQRSDADEWNNRIQWYQSSPPNEKQNRSSCWIAEASQIILLFQPALQIFFRPNSVFFLHRKNHPRSPGYSILLHSDNQPNNFL